MDSPARRLKPPLTSSASGLSAAAAILCAWLVSLLGGLWADLGFASAPQAAWTLGLFCLRTFLYVGLFITAHDAMHGVVAPQHPRLNAAIGRLCLTLYALLSWQRMREGHMRHHAEPTGPSDPDASADTHYLPWLLAFFRSYIDGWVIARNGVVVTALWLIGIPALDLAILCVLPAWLSILQLFTFGTWAPHRARPGRDVDEHRAVSANVPPVVSFLACYHFGYHWEHHAFPHVPWWALPTVRRQVLATHAGSHEGTVGL